jgi:diguanylate cyclase (GGDEF)-like protein
MRVLLRLLWLLLGAGLVVHVAHAIVGFGGHEADHLVGDVLYVALLIGSALMCGLRAALVRERRVPWAILAAGLLCWASGDLYWSIAIEGTKAADGVTLADAGWLSFYPAAYVAIVLLVRARMPRFRSSLWLDGLIGSLAVGGLGTAVVLPTIEHSASGAAPLTLAVNLAYPIFDLLLVGAVLAVFALTAWRPDRMWLLLGVGLAVSGVADGWYELALAKGTYVSGGLTDSLWVASTLVIARAAWAPVPRARSIRLEGLRVLVVPTALGLLALGVEIYDHFVRVDLGGLLLANGALLTVLVRMFMSFRENQAMLARREHEALTDLLTGLGNRRRLMADLDRALERAAERPTTLAVFDLDGFKAYNDAYGHPAGDALLARLGQKLAHAIDGSGRAYRIGGDEFCVLLRGDDAPEQLLARAAGALTEHGRGFHIGSSHGAVSLHEEARSASESLQIADQRLYRQKAGRSGSARTQARDVLMRVLRAREPELAQHLRNVSDLAVAVARRLALPAEEIDEIARGAELHDIGKMAIPDAILDKQGPLDDREWTFIHRHTMIGEGILAAAPALAPVARLVRASHERFDGKGYPDGLAGEAIPIGSRIIFACDAYDAMTSARPYAAPMPADAALAQITRGAGNQFDPAVTAALADVIRDGYTPSSAPLTMNDDLMEIELWDTPSTSSTRATGTR